MGEVYRARDPRLGRDVAIKVLPVSTADDPAALHRFEREARAIAAMSHPNILAIHDVGTTKPPFIVTELLEGETLRALIGRGPQPAARAIDIVVQLTNGLDAAHGRGIVHRDLKPDNIFLTCDGVVKILDFGLAKTHSALAAVADVTRALDTMPGTLVGTVGYMSPEQVRGAAADPRADIFAVGAILYELVTGKRAFCGGSMADTMSAILNEQPQFEGGRRWPHELLRIVQRCLSKNPEHRFQSGGDLAAALRSLRRLGVEEHAVDSVAVLPFTNTGGIDADYLSDGIAESLINNLARIPKLRVVPRSTVFRYKGTDLDPRTLGEQLQARLLLTGKVLLRGERLLVQVDLVDSTEHKQLWGERFNRTCADIFEVEDEIARQIADKLRLRLSVDEQQQFADHATKDPMAYDMYLKARYHWAKRTPESIRKAIECLEAAIARDSHFALAWAGLADTRILFGWYGAGVIRDLFDGATAAAQTAVRLDPDLAEGHAALGFSMCCTGDWDAGLRECELAIELNPAYFLAYDWLAIPLAALGRFEEALAMVGKAKSLEPLSLVVHHHQAWVNVMADRFSHAVEISKQALELDPHYSFAWWWRGIAETEMEQTEEGVRSLERAHTIFGDFQLGESALGHAFGRAGRRNDALGCLHALEQHDPRHVDPYHMALVHAGLGQASEAISNLKEAANRNSTWLRLYGPHDPRLDSLRDDQQFQGLLERAVRGVL